MDPMVIKYLGLSGITYGTHAFLAIAQIALCIFMVANGVILLSKKTQVGKWVARFGLAASEKLGQTQVMGWLMILTGVGLIVPLFGVSHWIAIISCGASIYWLMALSGNGTDNDGKKTGGVARKGLLAGAVLVLGFTVWEGRDLMRAAWEVSYKAVYWRSKEVAGWQHDNNPNIPKPGEMAPDFELTDVHGEKTVRLSDFRGQRPVVLLFGSFT